MALHAKRPALVPSANTQRTSTAWCGAALRPDRSHIQKSRRPMTPKHLALATALAAPALATPVAALAQSSLTIYGIADVGVRHTAAPVTPTTRESDL